MKQDKQGLVWFQDEENKWVLLRQKCQNMTKELKGLSNLSLDESKKPSEDDSLFHFTKKKVETKGQLVYTPDGYGIIQKINESNNTILVKKGQEVKEYPKKKIQYDIPLDLLLIDSSITRFERVIIPVNSQAKDIVEKIEELLGSSTNINYSIYYKGKQFERGPETCEALSLVPMSKMTVTLSMGRVKVVSRFKSVCNGWGYGGSVDGICFTASRNIRVMGFGVYLSQKETLETTCRLFKGDSSTKEEYTLTKDIMITAEDTSYNPKIYQVLFDKPLDLSSGDKMSCLVLIKNHTSQYGSGGLTVVTGEDDTVFTFSQCKASTNGTSTSSGQIPEVYYI